jgi:hypothetical protein
VQKLTLDTNLLHELWKGREKQAAVEALLTLADQGQAELAVTGVVDLDVGPGWLDLDDRLHQLPTLGIARIGKVARAGTWVIGEDVLGSGIFEGFRLDLEDRRKPREPKLPDIRDWDHLHTHYVNGRDIFLTWDKAILRLADVLLETFGVHVMTPEQYLEKRSERAPQVESSVET